MDKQFYPCGAVVFVTSYEIGFKTQSVSVFLFYKVIVIHILLVILPQLEYRLGNSSHHLHPL